MRELFKAKRSEFPRSYLWRCLPEIILTKETQISKFLKLHSKTKFPTFLQTLPFVVSRHHLRFPGKTVEDSPTRAPRNTFSYTGIFDQPKQALTLSLCKISRHVSESLSIWDVLSGYGALFWHYVEMGGGGQPFQPRPLEQQPQLTWWLISATQINLGEKTQPALPGLHNGEQIKGWGLKVLHLGVLCYVSKR